MDEDQIAWTAEIGCDGGPVLVANVADFRHWRGSEPFPPDARRELHFWSPFTGELPEAFQPNGPTGHQFIASEDPAALRAELVATVLRQWPDARVDRSRDTWIVTRADGRRLSAALAPESEYDLAIRDLDQETVDSFADGRCGYFWSAEPGVVRVDVRRDRREMLLTQVRYADADDDGRAGQAFARNAVGASSSLTYVVTDGAIVVVWGPSSVDDLRPEALPVSSVERTDALLDLATAASGTLTHLAPGTYVPSLGFHDDERWGVAWCRLRLADESQ